MKKVTILFLAFLMLFSANVFAVDYDLYVASVQINDANKDNISAAVVAAGQTATGTITYDPTSNTLTLDGASINATYDGIRNQINNLTINLLGENTISAGEDGIEANQANFTITGNGSLTINADYAIYQNECNLTIENTTVIAIGNINGITGENSSTEVLSITNSTVKATGTSQGSIVRINNLVLNGSAITQPDAAVFDNHAVCVNGEVVKTEVVITPTIPVAIEESIYENIIFQVKGKELTVVNTENLPIRIYNLVGQEIAYKENSNNQESFNLPQTGVYIVKIGNKSEKIFIK